MKKLTIITLLLALMFSLSSCGDKENFHEIDRNELNFKNEEVDDFESFKNKYDTFIKNLNNSNISSRYSSFDLEQLQEYGDNNLLPLDEIDFISIEDEIISTARYHMNDGLSFLVILGKDSFKEDELYEAYDDVMIKTYANEDSLYFSRTSYNDDGEVESFSEIKAMIIDEQHVVYEYYHSIGSPKTSQVYSILDSRIGMTKIVATVSGSNIQLSKEVFDFKEFTYNRAVVQNTNGLMMNLHYQVADSNKGIQTSLSKTIRHNMLTEEYDTSTSKSVTVYDENGYKQGRLVGDVSQTEDLEFYYEINAFTNIDNIKEGGLYQGNTLIYSKSMVMPPESDSIYDIYRTSVITLMNVNLDSFNPSENIGDLETNINFNDFKAPFEELDDILNEYNVSLDTFTFMSEEYNILELAPVMDDMFKDIPEEYK